MDTTDILAGVMNELENDLIHSLQTTMGPNGSSRVATGNTIAEFQTIITPENGQLLVPKYIDALEYGRAPTSPGAPAGDPTVYDQIKIWAAARGIAEFETDENGKQVDVWRAITASIHKKGFVGSPGILTEPLSDDNIDRRMGKGMDQLGDLFGHQVADIFDVFETI